jgi:nicotinate-nucleotide adenylyltransferase
MKTKKTDARIKNAANTTDRLALFGGSFDPVHCAHLEVAHCALQQAGVDRVIFIPAAQSPLKRKPFARDADRLQMLRLALENEARFELETFEIERSGSSFTIDTVDYFIGQYGYAAELFWIIGEDQYDHLWKWYRIDELVKKVVFLVYPRLESHRNPEKAVDSVRYQLLKAKTISISSTEVRKRREQGLRLNGLVPESVEAFICKKGLYKGEIKDK